MPPPDDSPEKLEPPPDETLDIENLIYYIVHSRKVGKSIMKWRKPTQEEEGAA